MMHTVLTILAIPLLLIGGWISLLNWYCFYLGVIKKTKTPSWTPLLGASACCGGLLGLSSMLQGRFSSYWWLPFLLDYGSLPGIGYSIVFHLLKKRRNSEVHAPTDDN